MRSFICFLAFVMILFISCDKKEVDSLPNYPGSSAPNSTPDSLKGREFVFDSLVWIDNDFGSAVFYIENMSYFKPDRDINVAIRHDTSAWEQVINFREAPATLGYLYNVSFGVLAVWPNPAQSALIGKRFSLKVNFL